MHARNGRDPTGLRKRTTKVDLSAAFRTNGRRRIGAKAVASRKGNLRHGSGAKCHAPAASRQEAAADRRRRCMVRMNICGLLWLSERWDRDEMRDASRGDGLCATWQDPSTPGVIKMDDVMLARITQSRRRRAFAVNTASHDPTSSAVTKPGTLAGAMPAKLSLNMRPKATAGLANDVDAVNQYAAPM